MREQASLGRDWLLPISRAMDRTFLLFTKAGTHRCRARGWASEGPPT
ncbi:hypothetical protein [Aureimonas sp. AU40]|nr:hypothetical protein [Aureimonas sp. AU40]